MERPVEDHVQAVLVRHLNAALRLNMLTRDFISGIVPSYDEGLASLYLRRAADPILDRFVDEAAQALGLDVPVAALFKLAPENAPRMHRQEYLPIVEAGAWHAQHGLWLPSAEFDTTLEQRMATQVPADRFARLATLDFRILPCRVEIGENASAGGPARLAKYAGGNPLSDYLQHRVDAGWCWEPLMSVDAVPAALLFGDLAAGRLQTAEERFHVLVTPAIVHKSQLDIEFVAVLITLCAQRGEQLEHGLPLLGDFLRDFSTICGEISEAKQAESISRYRERHRLQRRWLSHLSHTFIRVGGLRTTEELLGEFSDDDLAAAASLAASLDDPRHLVARIVQAAGKILPRIKYGIRMLRNLQKCWSDQAATFPIKLDDVIRDCGSLLDAYVSAHESDKRITFRFNLPSGDASILRAKKTRCAVLQVLLELCINGIEAAAKADVEDNERKVTVELAYGPSRRAAKLTVRNPADKASIEEVGRLLYNAPPSNTPAGGLESANDLLRQVWASVDPPAHTTPCTIWRETGEGMCGLSFFIPLEP